MVDDRIHHGDYRTWRHIDYQPVVESLLPTALLDYVRPGQQVMEVGCGRGEVSIFLAQHGLRVEGIDLNPAAIRLAQAKSEAAGCADLTTFVVGDFIQSEPRPATADVVVLIRVLTCVTDRRHWSMLLARSLACLREPGLLYVRDFLVTPDSYADRYQSGVNRGWRFGTFGVPAGAMEPLFLAHHHTDIELAEICAPYSVQFLERDSGISMNGNPCQTFELVAKKTRNDPQ